MTLFKILQTTRINGYKSKLEIVFYYKKNNSKEKGYLAVGLQSVPSAGLLE